MLPLKIQQNMSLLLHAEYSADYWAKREGKEAEDQYTYYMNFIQYLIKSVDKPDYCSRPVQQHGASLVFPSL